MKKAALLAICGAVLVIGAVALDWTPGGPAQALSGWTLLESEPISVEAALALAADPAAPFADYDGGGLPRSEGEGSRLYLFRTIFALPESARGQDLALALGPGDYPRDLYLNGVRILKTGVHGERYVSTLYYSSLVGLPPQLLRHGSEANELLVLAYPEHETSPLGTVYLGGHEEAAGLVFVRDFFNVNLIQAALVTAFIISVFFFFLFFRSPDKDRRYLWVALMCLAFSAAYSNMSFFHDGMDDVLLDKISRVGFTLTALFLLYFSLSFTGFLRGKSLLKSLLALPAAAAIVGTLAQADKKGIADWLAGFSTNFVLTPFLLLTLAVFVVGFVRKRSVDRLALLLGFLATIGASLHDMAFVTARRTPFCWLIAYAYLLLLVSIFFVLALEQAATSRALARQSGALNERNRMLKEMVGDLTGVAEGLISSSASLEGTLDSTLRSVESFGEETRLAAEVFRLQMGAVESEIAQISERMALSAERVPKALDSQTQAVEEMNATLAEMKEKIDASGESAEESNRIAGELAKEAEGGRAVIGESRRAMGQVSELSGALQGVLASIEDIAERTHVLSINAAIESARLGAEGKGFAVVAQEIRKLSEQSRTSLGSSFAKIAEMAESVGRSAELSDKAAETLGGIAEESRRSAERTEAIRRLIEEQREQGRAMLKDAESLLSEARLLKELSGEEKRSNEEREAQFRAMKESLQAVSRKLSEQEAHKRELGERLSEMRRSAEANAGHIAALRSAIDKVRGSLAG